MSKLELLKQFVMDEKEYLEGRLDISTVKRRYKQVKKINVGREDVTDALIELRKDGLIENDLQNLVMKYVE